MQEKCLLVNCLYISVNMRIKYSNGFMHVGTSWEGCSMYAWCKDWLTRLQMVMNMHEVIVEGGNAVWRHTLSTYSATDATTETYVQNSIEGLHVHTVNTKDCLSIRMRRCELTINSNVKPFSSSPGAQSYCCGLGQNSVYDLQPWSSL